MLVKKKNIVLFVEPAKRSPDLIVSISIEFNSCNYCYKRLKNNCVEEPSLVKGAEEAALAFALYEYIRDKLSGSSLEFYNNRVSAVDTYIIDNHLVINWKTQGTSTALRKTVGIALSCLSPSKLFTKYSQNIKFLSGQNGKKEEFNYLANLLSESIKKSVYIIAIGRINIDEHKLQTIMDTIHRKVPSIINIKDAKKPTHVSISRQYPVIKAKGLEAAIVADYIRNNSNGMSVEIGEAGVIVYSKNWEAKHTQLKDEKRIKTYVEKKYIKLEAKEELNSIFAYFSLSNGYCTAQTAEKIIDSKLTTKKLIDLLNKTL
jgi:hypothetical protein